ncbi:hypothetical protein D4R75_14235 [bacterium]|nr:MAG: hypothetical protein D4R75_14235 [bacterium]
MHSKYIKKSRVRQTKVAHRLQGLGISSQPCRGFNPTEEFRAVNFSSIEVMSSLAIIVLIVVGVP